MDINVYYNNWNQWYEKILNDFNFNRDDDEKSAQILNSLIDEKYEKNFSKKEAIIIGAGPSIKKHIQYIKKHYNLNDYVIIAADGATTCLFEEDILPDIIVTDLDGNIENIIKANRMGSILYVHAHGDNIDRIRKYVPIFTKVIPTTQSRTYDYLENYGGFTDGDRAIHIAVFKYKFQRIILAGMDFGEYVTKYSRPNIKKDIELADEFKQKKLLYAQKLTKSLIDNNKNIEFIDLMKI